MANITLSELNVAGSELFQDSESFLNELSNLDAIAGGQIGFGAGAGITAASNPMTIMKLAEAFVTVYAIDHVTLLAKSFSQV
jgi:hypothetical protein